MATMVRKHREQMRVEYRSMLPRVASDELKNWAVSEALHSRFVATARVDGTPKTNAIFHMEGEDDRRRRRTA